MFVGREYLPAYSFTSLLDGLDFTNDLDTGDSVFTATANLTVQTGTDPSPSSHLIGAPLVLPSNVVLQGVGNLLPGVTYILQIVANTTQGDSLSLYSRIPCRPIY